MFIEEKIKDKWGDGVDIINRSMDGIIIRAVYKYRAPIKRAVYIACPPFGSPVADFVLHPQINSQQFMSSVHFPYVPTVHWRSHDSTRDSGSAKPLYQKRKALFFKFPSIYELLPDESYLSNRLSLFTDNKPMFSVDDGYLKTIGIQSKGHAG